MLATTGKGSSVDVRRCVRDGEVSISLVITVVRAVGRMEVGSVVPQAPPRSAHLIGMRGAGTLTNPLPLSRSLCRLLLAIALLRPRAPPSSSRLELPLCSCDTRLY